MLTRVHFSPVFYTLCALVCLNANAVLAQSSARELQKILHEKAAFEPADFTALQQGQTVVKLTPITDKREIAACGLVTVRTEADQFLRSYLDGMTRTNQTVLEVGRFKSAPDVADLQHLTIEPRDIDDLKECVVGDC